MFDRQEFLQWFQNAGGWYNPKVLDIIPYAGMAYGAIALDNVAEDEPLFHIPDNLVLSPFSSDLKDRLSEAEWETLAQGWAQIILVMMYESIKGDQSRWSGYLSNMPTDFDTPMFWSEEDRQELAGTDIEDRVGREDAELEYANVLLPVINAHPEIFPVASPHTTIAAFHIQGSRILSRSFTVPVSHFDPTHKSKQYDDGDSSDSDEEEEEMAVVMVPFADMLNAAWEKDNAHLFLDEDSLKDFKGGVMMKSTRAIEKGEQVYNTYGSPPNSELLRKYGHVDVLPLSADILELLSPSGEVVSWPFGNPGDELLLQGDLLVKSVAEELGSRADEKWQEDVQGRIDWWLEEGQEDVFPLSLSDELDSSMISFVRILLSDGDWEKAQKKGKVPRAVVDDAVASVIVRTIHQRLGKYPGDNEHDIALVQSAVEQRGQTETRTFCAAVVRLGEKRILQLALRNVARALGEGSGSKKRKAVDPDERGHNKKYT